ncbi:hypothetical protein GGI20_005088 [Coemansia sp. BCRC 34301]|nr:hypothetical protein GGI20_005088 [Coemansia sp. BCRC 34301]
MGSNEYTEHEPNDRSSIRQGLERDLEGQGKSEAVPIDTFYSFADDTNLVFTSNSEDSLAKKRSPEGQYVATFKQALAKLTAGVKGIDMPPAYSTSPYKHRDYQNCTIKGSKLKPDLAFFQTSDRLPSISTECLLLEAKQSMSMETAFKGFLGQFSDYALEVWKHQPMRTFVPLLLLLGCHLHLVIFTREGYYKADIGQVTFQCKEDILNQAVDVGLALHQLWFILTLPVSRLGMLDSSTEAFEYLEIDSSVCPATLTTSPTARNANVVVMGSIKQRIPIVGRCAHLFRVSYDKKPAILKLAWTRANRLPEGAVYEVLATKDGDGNSLVSGIPKIYSSGILVMDVDGYRLEFLLMEDCGEPIVSYFGKLRQSNLSSDVFSQAVIACVQSVMQTLAEARHVSVLHRDISTGNIAIKGGRAYVIDWGYAKLLCPPNEPLDTVTAKNLNGDSSFKKGFAERWGMDLDKVAATENTRDPFTGTSLYMSVQVLLQVPRRSIFNDFESLFYVILDTLSNRGRTVKARSPLGFEFFSSESMALMRIAILMRDDLYLSDFGVDVASSPALSGFLAAMHKFLFFEGGHYIGGNLRGEYQHQFDREAAALFMNEATLGLLEDTPESTTQALNSPQKSGPSTSEPDARELTTVLPAKPQLALCVSELEALTTIDSDSGSEEESADPMANDAKVPYSPTPSSSRIQAKPRARKPASSLGLGPFSLTASTSGSTALDPGQEPSGSIKRRAPGPRMAANAKRSFKRSKLIYAQAEDEARQRQQQSVRVTRAAEKHFDSALGRCNWQAVSSEVGLPLIECVDLFDASASMIKPRSLIDTTGGWSKMDVDELKQFVAAYFADSSAVDRKLVGAFMNVDVLECQHIGQGTINGLVNAVAYRRICEYCESGRRWKGIHQHFQQYPTYILLWTGFHHLKRKLEGRLATKYATEWTGDERERAMEIVRRHQASMAAP